MLNCMVSGAAWRTTAPSPVVILCLFLFALLVRVGAAWQTVAIFNDGPAFLEIAGQMRSGDWAAALAHHYHPLYPLLTATVDLLVGSFERSGLLVSIVSGSLGVVPLYLFLRWSFGEQNARVGAVNPDRNG